MTNSPPSTARQATSQAATANGKPVPDTELLRRFVRLADEAAFAVLVRRYSGLVIGVCRRVLRSEHDIEDAFQATFLVLARDAGRIRKSDSLASWLHGVAYRTSLRAADSTRRRGRLLRELTMIEDTLTPDDESGPLADVEQRHQQQALDEELATLSDNYRAALVLHYLDGKSNQQVAEELGLSVTAVEGRLKRGKKELRLRLARRGIGLSVAVAAMQAVESSAQAAAPLEPLIARAIDAGLSFAGGEAAGPVYSPEAARLAGQELMTMSATTTATLAAVVLLPLALGFAGHAPVAGPAGSTAIISTTLAQADATGVQGLVAQEAGSLAQEQTADIDRTAKRPDPLERQVSLNFKNAPLAAALREVASSSGINVTIDSKGLERAGVDEQTPVTINTQDINLRSALKLILDPLNLSWRMEDDVLSITASQGENRVAEEDLSFADVNGFQVMSVDDEAGKVTITYMKDGKVHSRVVDLAQEDAESGNLPPATGGGFGAAGGMGMPGKGYDSFMDAAAAGMMSGGAAPAPAGIRDYSDTPAGEQRIADLLKQPTQVEFFDTPLHDAMDFLAELNNMPIMIDETALTDVGIPTDEPVNLVMNGVTLQSVLNRILEPRGLTTIIRDEVLHVTTNEVADQYMVTRVYDISDLAGIEQEQLLKTLQESLPDADWKDNDGAGGTASILDGALVVKQSQSAHRQIVDLLGQLGRHLQRRPQSQTSQSFEFDGAGMQFNLQGMGAPATPQADTSKSTGLVLATKPDASGREFVQISLGYDDGLRLNESLQIRRERSGSEHLLLVGLIQVVYINSENLAVGRVVATDSQLTIERGDQVVRASAEQGNDAGNDDIQGPKDLVGMVTGRRIGHTKNVEDVEVQIGSENGVKEGDELIIYSFSGSPLKPIARIRVYEVTASTVRAHVFSQVEGTTIQMGDNVGLDPVFGRQATPGAGPDAAVATPRKELTLQIDADGNAHHDGASLTSAQMQKLLQKEQPSVLILRADPSAPPKSVSGIIDAASGAVEGIRFALKALDSASDLPAAEASEPKRNHESKELTLYIDAEGRAHYDGKPVSIAQLRELVQKEQASLLILRVDRSASSQAVSDFINAAKAAGVAELRFAPRAIDAAGEAQPAAAQRY